MNFYIAGACILAAGQGKRMKSDLPKVLHNVCDTPMLHYVLNAAKAVNPERIVVVLGHGAEQVRSHLPADCNVAIQKEQKGTGHALLSAAEQLPVGAVLVMPGDTPLITGEALQRFVAAHNEKRAVASVLTMILDDPAGYGRIVRGENCEILRIVEHRDASEEELAINEVNAGMYVLPIPEALEVLQTVGSENDQGEVYLTDVVAGLLAKGKKVEAWVIKDANLVLGVNSAEELAVAEYIMKARSASKFV